MQREESFDKNRQSVLTKARELDSQFARAYALRDRNREFPHEEMSAEERGLC